MSTSSNHTKAFVKCCRQSHGGELANLIVRLLNIDIEATHCAILLENAHKTFDCVGKRPTTCNRPNRTSHQFIRHVTKV